MNSLYKIYNEYNLYLMCLILFTLIGFIFGFLFSFLYFGGM